MSKAPSAATIWLHVFVPLTVLALYLVSLSFFYSWLLPEYIPNVNAVFFDRAWKFVLAAAGVSYLVFLIIRRRTGEGRLTLGDAPEKIRAVDFLLIPLPLAPVVQYVLTNQDILSPLGSLYVLAVFVIFSVVFIAVIPALLGAVGSTRTLMLLGTAFAFTITSMASLSARFAWFQEGSLLVQLAVFSAVFVGARALYTHQMSRKFLYIFIVAFFVSGVLFQSMAVAPERSWAAETYDDNRLIELVDSRTPLSTPSIYLLVYESYVINETMLAYGIDNSAQEEYLKDLGFKLYPHTYSVGRCSLRTMSRVMNASTEFYGDIRRGVSGDGVVHSVLRSFGYESHGTFPYDFMFRGVGSSYDVSFPVLRGIQSAHRLLMTATFMGEFKFDVDLEFDAPSPEEFLHQKARTFQNVPDTPRFVYMHDPRPGHSQNSGVCLPNETELYEEGLIEANRRMKQDVETLIQSDPDSIIIVAGDHGPYLTKNCVGTGRDYDISEISRLDIQDRYGTFLAIRWPTDDFSAYDDITVLQDLFPAILAYLFNDAELLRAKVEPETLDTWGISRASVQNGIIYGGINDGEPLFLSGNGSAGSTGR